MGSKIGKPGFILNIEPNLNVPQLFAELLVSEEHTKHIRAIQIFEEMLNAVAVRAMKINDPVLIEKLTQMKVIVTTNQEDHFEDI